MNFIKKLTTDILIKDSAIVQLLFIIALAGCVRTNSATDYDAYGGTKHIERAAMGYFRVDSTKGRWLFGTPEGHGYFAVGANHTGKFLLDSSQSGSYLARFGGDTAEVRKDLYQNCLHLDYNASEAYAPIDPYLKNRLPYIAHLEYPQRDYLSTDIFDSKEQERLFQHTVAQCQSFRNDKMLIGIAFKDLPLWTQRRVDFYHKLPLHGRAPPTPRHA